MVPLAGEHNVLLELKVPATVAGSTAIVMVFESTAVHGVLVTRTLYVVVPVGETLVNAAKIAA